MVNNLENLMDHEKECSYNDCFRVFKETTICMNESWNNCSRCEELNVEVGNHDCLESLLRLIVEIRSKIKSLTLIYNELKKEVSSTEFQSQIDDLGRKLDLQWKN